MKQVSRGAVSLMVLAGVAVSGAVADVTYNSGQLDTHAQTLVGREGSVGQHQDDPAPVNAPVGFTMTRALSSVGPIPPGEIVSFPGTSAVATGRGYAISNVYAPSPSGMVIDVLVATDEHVDFGDGGSVLGTGDASFLFNFTTTGVVPWSLTGYVDFDTGDTLGWCQLTGFLGALYFSPGPGGGAFGPRQISMSGTLDASIDGGVHEFKGSVRASAGDSIYRDSRQRLRLIVGTVTPPCPADLGQQGGVPGPDGQLDNNDFIVFIDYFFGANPLADIGVQGGIPGSDGQFDNNDFIVFIDQFFAGC